jgi:hypothetical protein
MSSRSFFNDAPVKESDQSKPGVILDYASGNVVGIEILNASTRTGDPMSLEYAIAH